MSDIKNADEVNAGKKSVKDLGITAIGKYKLQVDLERPVPYINELLALNTFNPQNEKVAKSLENNMVQLLKSSVQWTI